MRTPFHFLYQAVSNAHNTLRLVGELLVVRDEDNRLALGVQAPLLLLLGAPGPHAIFALALTLLAVVRHRENLRRLLAGTENRVGKKG